MDYWGQLKQRTRSLVCRPACPHNDALGLVELLLSLPASNEKVEWSFSQMNVVKINKQSLLSNDTLHDLLLLAVDVVPLAEFKPNAAIDCWWNDKQLSPNQRKRKQLLSQLHQHVRVPLHQHLVL